MIPFDVFATAHYEGNYFKDKHSSIFAEALVEGDLVLLTDVWI